MNQTTEENGTLLSLAPASILPSLTNPRKAFDPVALEELTQNIRIHGVHQPILVRPWPEDRAAAVQVAGFEIIAGERRWRAATAAGLETMPCIVRQMGDAEALSLQMLENLHRADLHPVEEAEGYRVLMATEQGYGPADLAPMVGKTEAYVAQRLKLLDLEILAKRIFVDGYIGLGHAIHLARLTVKDQERAVRELLLGAGQRPKKDTSEAIYTAMVAQRTDPKNPWAAKRRLIDTTEAQLKDWIEANVMLALKKAPWDLASPAVYPLAGPCTTCPKRTGSNQALFADLTADDDVCLDPACFGTKRANFINITTGDAKTDGQAMIRVSFKSSHKALPVERPERFVVREGQWLMSKKGGCESTTRAIAVDNPSHYNQENKGRKAGDLLYVCPDQKCKTHKHTVDGTKGAAVGETWEVRQAREQAEEAAVLAAEKPVRRAVFDAARTNVLRDPAGQLAILLIRSIDHGEAIPICEALGLDLKFPKAADQEVKTNVAKRALRSYLGHMAGPEEWGRFAFYALALGELEPNAWLVAHNKPKSREDLWEQAQAAGVNPDAIAKRVETGQAAGAVEDTAVAPAKAAGVTRGRKPAKKAAARKAGKK